VVCLCYNTVNKAAAKKNGVGTRIKGYEKQEVPSPPQTPGAILEALILSQYMSANN